MTVTCSTHEIQIGVVHGWKETSCRNKHNDLSERRNIFRKFREWLLLIQGRQWSDKTEFAPAVNVRQFGVWPSLATVMIMQKKLKYGQDNGTCLHIDVFIFFFMWERDPHSCLFTSAVAIQLVHFLFSVMQVTYINLYKVVDCW